MAFDPSRHHRRSIRLCGYDYARAGLYFVTVCTRGRKCLLGAVEADGVRLNAAGQIAEEEWLRTPEERPYVVLDAFVVMPNHVHLLFGITEPAVGATRRVAPTSGPASGSVGAIIGQYKTVVTKRINALRQTPGAPVRQRNYYERVVRNAREADHIRRYVAENPLRWHLDRYHPSRSP